MKKLHISAVLPSPIQECRVNFHVIYPNYGNGTICLSPYGEYDLTVSGITDGAARRSQEYKSAYKKVSMDMLHAYEADNKKYTAIHRGMKKVITTSDYEKELMEMTPEKYKRSTFTLPMPKKEDVENDLITEAQAINFNKSEEAENIDEKQFVRQNLNRLVEERQHSWQVACNLFNKIEDAREERTNANYFAEYKKLYDKKKAFIEGDSASVDTAIKDLCDTIDVPCDISLSYEYDKGDKTLSVKLIAENGINVPTSKATILASGKISIKNKMVKETIFDRTNSTISLVYYIGAELFNVSPNIQYLRISLYDKTLQSPLLWVEFDRDSFSKINPLTIGVVSHILGYSHVTDFKMKGDALDLPAMKTDVFEKQVAAMGHKSFSTGGQSEYHFEEKMDGKIYVSMETAQKLLAIPTMETDVRKAIAYAKDYGWQQVGLDAKYKTILMELAYN